MLWRGSFYIFTPTTVSRLAPAAPGIYVLWRRGQWVYVGATENIRDRLFALAAGESECITKEVPTDFGFEVITVVEQRDARLDKLQRELMPICR